MPLAPRLGISVVASTAGSEAQRIVAAFSWASLDPPRRSMQFARTVKPGCPVSNMLEEHRHATSKELVRHRRRRGNVSPAPLSSALSRAFDGYSPRAASHSSAMRPSLFVTEHRRSGLRIAGERRRVDGARVGELAQAPEPARRVIDHEVLGRVRPA